MRELKLENDIRLATVEDEDYGRVICYKWYVTNNSTIHRNFKVNYKSYYVSLAQEIMQLGNVMFDHIDRNWLNCKKDNLRICSHSTT